MATFVGHIYLLMFLLITSIVLADNLQFQNLYDYKKHFKESMISG